MPLFPCLARLRAATPWAKRGRRARPGDDERRRLNLGSRAIGPDRLASLTHQRTNVLGLSLDLQAPGADALFYWNSELVGLS